jgi:oligopeptide transport system substrate-binding protein
VGAWNPDTAEATVFGWIAFVPDPITVFDRFTSMFWPPTGYNMTWWSNPRVDELYTLAQAEMDLDKRAEYLKEIQRIVMEEVPTVHHSIVTLPLAWNERVSGIKVRGNVTVDLTGVTISE